MINLCLKTEGEISIILQISNKWQVTLLKINLCFPHWTSYVYAKKCRRLEIISYIEFFISPPSHTVTHLGQCWCINGPGRLMHLFIYLINLISIEWTPLIVASQITVWVSVDQNPLWKLIQHSIDLIEGKGLRVTQFFGRGGFICLRLLGSKRIVWWEYIVTGNFNERFDANNGFTLWFCLHYEATQVFANCKG